MRLILLFLLVCTCYKQTSSFKLFSANRKLTFRTNEMKQDGPPPLTSTPKLKILLLVEPTPFNYISGYANRFKEMIKYLHKAGDTVYIITPDDSKDPPKEFLGFQINSPKGWRFPLYPDVVLSFDFRGLTAELVEKYKPDIIHVTSPGALLFSAVFASRKFKIPLVMSYHTNFPSYAKSYVKLPGSVKVAEFLTKLLHSQADLTLVTSSQLKKELLEIGVPRVDVWQKGIDVDRFSPTFKSAEMRNILSDGHPEAPLLIYVGRLGVEKGLKKLKIVLDANPGVRLALVGKGPQEEELKLYFKDYPVYFAGQYTGDKLSQAFASADVFAMPSDSETLGFVVLEAMASGIPVVGVAAGGLVELIQDKKTGYLVSNDDNMAEFSRAVKNIFADRNLIKEMGMASRKWSEGFGWEAATSYLRNCQYRLAIELSKSRDYETLNDPHLDAIDKVLMDRFKVEKN